MKTTYVAIFSAFLLSIIHAKEVQFKCHFIRTTPAIGKTLLEQIEHPDPDHATISAKIKSLEAPNTLKILASYEPIKLFGKDSQVYEKEIGKFNLELEHEASSNSDHHIIDMRVAPVIKEDLGKGDELVIRTLSALSLKPNRWHCLHFSSDSKSADLVIADLQVKVTPAQKLPNQKPRILHQLSAGITILKLSSAQAKKVKLITPENREKAIGWLLKNGELICSANLKTRSRQMAILERQVSSKEKTSGLLFELQCPDFNKSQQLTGKLGWNSEPQASQGHNIDACQFVFTIDQPVEDTVPFILSPSKKPDGLSAHHIAIITPHIQTIELWP